ncbi:hypothetical protein OQA88_12047 [Cercophora sp. LCS_1]
MADQERYVYTTAPGRRTSPPLYNPARSSMPVTSVAYTNALYGGGGNIHDMTASHHEPLISRPAADYRRDPAPPVTTTTYAVRKEPLGRSTSVRGEGDRSHRPQGADVSSKRPIIVTTKHADNGRPPSSVRSGSPTRDPYRSSDEGQYYALPASSIPRSRGHGSAPYSTSIDNDEYRRLKERTEQDRLISPRTAETFRSTRPTVMYPTQHRTEFNEEGYEYTKPGELARYDLDSQQQAPRRSRRESVDRYYRPTVSVTTDFGARPYEQNERRQRGPPPTTWGLDKVNRTAAGGIYDGAGGRMPVPPAAPLPPDLARRHGQANPGSPERRSASRTRPISLIQDVPSRPAHHDDYYTSRDDDHIRRELRELRERERERELEREREREQRDRERNFEDGAVTARGFGIKVDPPPAEDHRRRYDESRERRDHRKDFVDVDRVYDDLDIASRYEPDRRVHRDRDDRDDRDRDRDRVRGRDRDYGRDRSRGRDHDVWVHDEFSRERPEAKGKEVASPEDEPEGRKEKTRDKLAAGIGIAAASLGLKPALKGDREDKDTPSSSRHRRERETDRAGSDEESRPRPPRKEPLLDDEEFEIIEHPKDPNRDRGAKSEASAARTDPRDRPDVGRDNGDARRDQSSSPDDGKPAVRRRHRASSAFNPNDTASLEALKAQLAAVEEREREKAIPTVKEPSPERKPQALEVPEADVDVASVASSAKDESRGRELAASREEKQVRVVSPPRDKEEKKPIKGILKQPKQQFPEEPNPIREGVAPHKDDKTKTDVPAGARWTKISRKMVNPEALTIGKERFEVRDDFVIVLRVLSKEEIQGYAAATAQLRERRRKEHEREQKEPKELEYDPDETEERRRQHRQHRIDGDDDRRERHRRRDDEEEYRRRGEYHQSHGHRSSHRERGRDRDVVYTEGP